MLGSESDSTSNRGRTLLVTILLGVILMTPRLWSQVAAPVHVAPGHQKDSSGRWKGYPPIFVIREGAEYEARFNDYLREGARDQQRRNWRLRSKHGPTALYSIRPDFNGTLRQIRTQGRNFYRLVACDLVGDRQNDCIAGATIDHRVCAFTIRGEHLWDHRTGGLVVALDARDTDGNGRDEIIAAGTDGMLHFLDHKGAVKWQFRNSFPFTTATIVKGDDGVFYIAAGTVGGQLYVLSCEGKLVNHGDLRLCEKAIPNSRRGKPRFCRNTAAGDFDGDEKEELFVNAQARPISVSNNDIFFLKIPALTQHVWKYAGMTRSQLGGMDPAVIDLDGDGNMELRGHACTFDPERGRLPISKHPQVTYFPSLPVGGYGYRMLHVTGGKYDGKDPYTFHLFGCDMTLRDKDDKPVHGWRSEVSFTDAVTAKDNGKDVVVLGSCPNGDDTLYVLNLFHGQATLKSQFRNPELGGVWGRIAANIQTLDKNIEDWQGVRAVGRKEPVSIILRGHKSFQAKKSKDPVVELTPVVKLMRTDWLERFPYHDQGVRFVLQLVRTEDYGDYYLRPDGRPWIEGQKANTHLRSRKWFIGAARYLEEQKIHFSFCSAHACIPYISPSLLKEIVKVAPNFFRGLHQGENARSGPGLLQLRASARDLTKVLAEAKGDYYYEMVFHNAWLYDASTRIKFLFTEPAVFKSILSPSSAPVRKLGPDVNIISAAGLMLTGQCDNFSQYCQPDDYALSGVYDWSKIMTGHPYMRQILLALSLGARHHTLAIDINFPYKTDVYPEPKGNRVLNEGLAQLIHMLVV